MASVVHLANADGVPSCGAPANDATRLAAATKKVTCKRCTSTRRNNVQTLTGRMPEAVRKVFVW